MFSLDMSRLRLLMNLDIASYIAVISMMARRWHTLYTTIIYTMLD